MQRHAGSYTLWISAVVLNALAAPLLAQPASPSTAAPAPAKPPMSDGELEQLVAPIALYPDSLMTQVLMASTYPLEVVEADRFAKANKDLKGDKLTEQLEKQTWDPSVKSLVNFPQVLDMMNQKLDATVKLGDAFIADQKRVLGSIQKLRLKAQAQGNLKTTDQQKVVVVQQPATTTQIIQIEPAQPSVIYVPTYNPTVVYGAWPYPTYPPYVYSPPAAYAAGAAVGAAVGFGVGVACGAAWGYAWGHCDWNHSDVNINVNQNNVFNKNINRANYQQHYNNVNKSLGVNNNNTWNHDASHRNGVAYRDNSTAQKFGGTTANQAVKARESFRGRADAGRQDIAHGGADEFRGRPGAGGSGTQRPQTRDINPGAGGSGTQRPGGGDVKPGAGGSGPQRPGGGDNRPGGGGSGVQRPGGGAAMPGGGSGTQHPSGNLGGGGGGIQNHGNAGTSKPGAFQGINQGGDATRASSARGASSRGGTSHLGGGGRRR